MLPVVAPLLQDEGLLAAARARPLPLLALEAAHRPVRKVLQRGAPGRHLGLLRGYCFFDFAACDGPLILFERFSLYPDLSTKDQLRGRKTYDAAPPGRACFPCVAF